MTSFKNINIDNRFSLLIDQKEYWGEVGLAPKKSNL